MCRMTYCRFAVLPLAWLVVTGVGVQAGDPQAKLDVQTGEGSGVESGLPGRFANFDIDTGNAKQRIYFFSPTDRGPTSPYQQTYSGYAIHRPGNCWFWESAVNLRWSVAGSKPFSFGAQPATHRVLASKGERVAFDLIAESPTGKAAIRTAALPGRSLLFVEAHRTSPGVPMELELWAYPCGHAAPLDRCIHLDGLELRNHKEAPKPDDPASRDILSCENETIVYRLDLGKDRRWCLLTDHAREPAAGQAGIVFDRRDIQSARAEIYLNYYIRLTLVAGPQVRSTRLVLCTFPEMTIGEAEQSLSNIAGEAEALTARALDGLPAPF
ncbi:MAG: hypothetical protein IT440_06700 [Phycisphaeraceae bacterium]|nr:hypothetical protein [Phycisphaeraceae bacterium]